MLQIGRNGPRVCVISNEDITEVGNDWQIMLNDWQIMLYLRIRVSNSVPARFGTILAPYTIIKRLQLRLFAISGSGSCSDKERLEPAGSGSETLLRIMKKKNGFLIIRIDICNCNTLIF